VVSTELLSACGGRQSQGSRWGIVADRQGGVQLMRRLGSEGEQSRDCECSFHSPEHVNIANVSNREVAGSRCKSLRVVLLRWSAQSIIGLSFESVIIKHRS
jgi:hypothetical protein